MSRVSIVIPAYNRAHLLPAAVASIRAQTYTDWELIIVDDGGKDDTREVVERLAADTPQTIRYVRRENGGPARARNTGIDEAKSPYIAFLDSDDAWYAHHLSDCIESLDANPDVDWVFGAIHRIDVDTGEVVERTTFRDGDEPRPFMRLNARSSGRLKIIEDDDLLKCLLLHDGTGTFQNSVYRSRVFEHRRIRHFGLGEDRYFPIEAIAAGCRIGYLDDVHVEYHIHHTEHFSGIAAGSCEKRRDAQARLITSFEAMTEIPMRPKERRALKVRLSREYFWTLGYAILWEGGRRQEALENFRKGMRHWPYDLGYWKTYLLAEARVFWDRLIGRTSPGASADGVGA